MGESHPGRIPVPQEAIPSSFALFLWGGKERFDRRKATIDTLSSHPLFSKDTVVPQSLARKDVWTRIAIQSKELVALKLRHGWSTAQFTDAIAMTDWMMPIHPQFRIFRSNLERQMSDEQKAIWLPKADRFEILGCYCQTELGHGSNVRGVETTATFSPDNDEFIIDSPTLSSTKYWIGAAGVWATHGIVVAKLIISGRDYGVHLFLVQLRDSNTHRTLPGVEIYELGPKSFQGMLGTDNGALRFHNVRIPRAQMLSRNAQVREDGKYIPAKNTKHAYGSMVTVRALMAEITGWDLIKAVVVAYHYTKFRRQFKKPKPDQNQSEETVVFDYNSVRYRLLPLLATATAIIVVGQSIKKAYDDYTVTMLKTGDTSELEDLHLQTVSAKVYSTELASKGVETCRIACGGHGYSAFSGFGRMYAHTVNAVTYEGDNYVISLQVTRAILKYYRQHAGQLPTSLEYLGLLKSRKHTEKPPINSATQWFSIPVQKWALEHRLANLVQQHLQDTEAGIDTSYSGHALTMAHSDYVYWKGFWKSVQSVEKAGESFGVHLRALAQVFSLSILSNPHHPSLSQALHLSQETHKHLRDAYAIAIDDLARNHMDSIITAYGLTEFELDSALARTNLNPYEALFDGAKKSEMSGENMSHIWPLIVDTTKLWENPDKGTVKDSRKGSNGLKGRL